MPSKSKRNSKAVSKLSQFDQSASSQSSSSLAPHKESQFHEDDLLRSLEEATRKYPSLIGRSALIGRITDVEAQSKGCKIWLSESSMVASSLAPGSTVSVSLAPRKYSSSFPLCSLADECAKHFGIGCSNTIVNDVGNYFALATAFPSCKVLKDGVRLSFNLSCTLGCPTSGRIVFVYPIQSQSTLSDNGNDKLYGTLGNSLLSNCKDLYLGLVSSKSRSEENGNMLSGMSSPGERFHSQFDNGKISSPMTPLYSKSKLGFPVISQMSSSRYEESISSSPNSHETSVDSFDIAEILGDESARKLVLSCATSWLCSRSLLCGNFVAIPILSKICIFQVISGSRMPEDTTNLDLTVKFDSDLSSQVSNLMEHSADAFLVNHKTNIHLVSHVNSASETPERTVLPCLELEFKDINADGGDDSLKLGGLSKEYAVLRDIIISSSLRDTLSSLGLRPTKGVLLHGPPGTGKTSLAQKCARDTGVNLFTVNGPEIVSQYYGESEQALHEVFDSASRATPAVVFIDELDAIAPARRDGGEELSQRMVATLLNLMDGISRTDGLLVIAATNRPESIEPALRRPGRLDREIEIGVPSPEQRHDILLALLSEMEHSLLDVQIQQLAMATHGFVGADLASLCNEASLVCLRRNVNFKKSYDILDSKRTSILFDGCYAATTEGSYCSKDMGNLLSRDALDSTSSSVKDFPVSSEIQDGVDNEANGTCVTEECILKVTFQDFEKAKMKVRPSAMRELILEVPKVNWKDVGGQQEVKMQLMEAVEWPQKHRDAFKRVGICPPTGVLMFGPPGCSKTLLARAVAFEAGLNFLAVKGPELFSKWVGESEKAVRSLFAKARANAPSIIFFDEIDGLAVIRGKESDGVSVADRVMSQLLVELDGLQQRTNVTVIAATNRPDKIDPALLRPGRFDRLLYVGPPNGKDREDIFQIHLSKMPCCPDVCIKELALRTEGCTGADISSICREAALAAIEESIDASEIRMEHLTTAIKQVQPSEIQSYEELSAKFQRLVYSNSKKEALNDQPCSRRSNWMPFWTLMKSIALFLYQFPAPLTRWRATSIE